MFDSWTCGPSLFGEYTEDEKGEHYDYRAIPLNYLVEERLNENLYDYVKGGKKIPSDYIQQIRNLLFLMYKNRGVIHGDLTPENIGIKGDRLYLIDFDILHTTKDFNADANEKISRIVRFVNQVRPSRSK